MAIRFDKDTRRATNGPMIFFSDPSAEISLSEEIRGAIEARLSFYAYRRPGDMMISFGSSESVAEGLGVPGFVIARFLPELPYLTIPYRPLETKHIQRPSAGMSVPRLSSTTREAHSAEINAIIRALKETGHGKVVAARVIVDEVGIDVAATFSSLCRKYPDAFAFCFSTPMTGCWIGASPELLLEAHSGMLHTMALAGTRSAGADGPWDIKNIEEQQMVTDFISDTFKRNSLQTVIGETFSRKAGIVEHLCTPISATVETTQLSSESLSDLLHDLSPTPALCGHPRNLALDIIKEYESFPRGCYGGFCGPYHSPGDFSFFVNLRSALVESERVSIFAGGGITHLSSPEEEWIETEMKSETIRQSLSVSPR